MTITPVYLSADELLLLRVRLSDGPGTPAVDSALDAKLSRAQQRPGSERDAGRREYLGRLVREVWHLDALDRPDVADHPSWTTDLPERDREVDRRIGEAVAEDERRRFEHEIRTAFQAVEPGGISAVETLVDLADKLGVVL